MNLPPNARERNWGGGSCVHASIVMCLRWQGLDDVADWWRRTYSGGEHASGLSSKLERAGVRFAYTTSGDVSFLEWACRTRRGCGITYFSNHFICLVHLDHEQAVLLDNNRIDRYLTVPRDEFLRRWQGYGGWACTPVYSPAPPAARAMGARANGLENRASQVDPFPRRAAAGVVGASQVLQPVFDECAFSSSGA